MRPLNMNEKDEQLFEKLVKRARALASDIRTVFAVDKPDERIYYVEMVRRGRRDHQQPSVSAAPLTVTELLREKLFDRVKTIATSATLAVGGDFGFFRARVGLDSAPGLTLPYAFDYPTHALLYLPRLRFDPAFGDASGPYLREIAEQMRALVEEAGGRAFLLFSSMRALQGVYNEIGDGLEGQGYATMIQGRDFSRLELLRQFRERGRAVLFGLKSFWEGVDVAGEALSLVVIDKLPFDPPDDPVQEARVSRMKAAGENWFGGYVLPNAILRLKQGVGRLIRTRDDRGVMAILDRRIYTKGYGREVMLALPPARRTERIEDVRDFFGLYAPDGEA
jgi:Rad3-related DNA helicase